MPKTANDMPISLAIAELVDTIKWSVVDDYDLSTIVWNDANVAQPSDADIQAKRQEQADSFNQTEYKDLRVNGKFELQADPNNSNEMILVKTQDGYPSTEEQLDYIYHNGVEAWKTDMIDAVKNRFPKPSGGS